MTDGCDEPHGPACDLDNTANQRANSLAPTFDAEAFLAPNVDASAAPVCAQAAPTTSNYRRSLFRR